MNAFELFGAVFPAVCEQNHFITDKIIYQTWKPFSHRKTLLQAKGTKRYRLAKMRHLKQCRPQYCFTGEYCSEEYMDIIHHSCDHGQR